MKDFKFKKFSVKQNDKVMKVGTDGVILGAYIKPFNAKNIIDIGTGTGLIALMLAQKFAESKITGIDINPEATELAKTNFQNSIWTKRLSAITTDLKQFKPTNKFDLIVSNPPFYSTNVLSPNKLRAVARHNQHLKPEDLLKFCINNLSENGKCFFIYPSNIKDEFIETAKNYGLVSRSVLEIKPNFDKEVIRNIIYAGFNDSLEIKSQTICIEKYKRHDFSTEYINMTKDYYLKLDSLITNDEALTKKSN